MVENEPKITRKDRLGCLGLGLGIAAGLTLIAYGAHWVIERIDIDKKNAAETEQAILDKSDLLQTHLLVPLNQAGAGFKDAKGYFKYLDTKDANGEEVSLVEFAWKRADGEIEISKFPLNKTTAVLDDQASEVDFDLKAKDCLTDEIIPHAIKSADPNKYVSRSESIIFSLSGQDLKNFKGPK